jgi:hypothetical protein
VREVPYSRSLRVLLVCPLSHDIATAASCAVKTLMYLYYVNSVVFLRYTQHSVSVVVGQHLVKPHPLTSVRCLVGLENDSNAKRMRWLRGCVTKSSAQVVGVLRQLHQHHAASCPTHPTTYLYPPNIKIDGIRQPYE